MQDKNLKQNRFISFCHHTKVYVALEGASLLNKSTSSVYKKNYFHIFLSFPLSKSNDADISAKF